MRLTGIKAALCASIVALAAAAPASAAWGYYWPSYSYWGGYGYWPSYGGNYYSYFPYTHSYYPYYSYYSYYPSTYSYYPSTYSYNPYYYPTYPSAYAYTPTVVAPQTVAAAPALTTYQSFYPSFTSDMAPSSSDTAVVRVLTAPDAQLIFNGVPMTQVGGVRTYETPGLQPGTNYKYDVKVRYTDNGVPVERDRTIHVTAGQTTTADLTPAALRQ